MAFLSNISGFVGNQIGRLQGELEATIQGETLKLLSKFSNECPPPNELAKAVKTRNSLLKTINNFQKIINVYSKLTNNLKPPLQVAKVVIKLLKSNPVPLAIGVPPPTGGLLFSRTTGFVNNQSDRLRNISLIVDALEGDISSIDGLIAGVVPSLNSSKQTLELIDKNINDCVDKEQQEGLRSSVEELLKEVQPLENTGTEGTPDESYTYRGINGKDYTLSIIEDRNIGAPVTRRVAIAKDRTGVVVLKGQPSFSSDTQILLDELKFKIDNQLP